ncbi:MAG TPA: AAA family ATPase [Puia sp.]|jgi:hypothetical protein
MLPGQIYESPLKIETVNEHINGKIRELEETPRLLPLRRNVFANKSANQWLKDASGRPQPKPLYMCMWYEGEVCIFFADTNTGKSILAVQIARDISEVQKVIYFDFELSDKQFEERYSEGFTNHYSFPENFYRAEIDPDQADYKAAGFDSMEDFISASMEQLIQDTGARVLIIDNLTYLKNETEKAKEALPLMKHLKDLKNKYGLSILALAHTPKRDLTQPITSNHLGGSKMLMNFCDSSFTMGVSAKDKSLRYLKQIKCRNGQIVYDGENVAIFEISKPANFLSISPVQGVHGVHTTFEHEHLKQHTKEDKETLISKVKLLYNNGIGKSYREIASDLNISLGTVSNYLKRSCSTPRSEQGEQAIPNEQG